MVREEFGVSVNVVMHVHLKPAQAAIQETFAFREKLLRCRSHTSIDTHMLHIQIYIRIF